MIRQVFNMSLSPTAREIKAAQTRSELCKAALTLFCEHGVQCVTIDDICTYCGVTKGAFYHHFPSKDHIITYSVNYELDCYIEKYFHMSPSQSVKQLLLHLQQLSFSYFQQLGKMMTRYSYEGQIHSLIALKQQERSYVSYLSQLIEQGIEKQLFRSHLDFENCYMMNIILFTGFLFKWSSIPEDKDSQYQWDRILEELVDSLFV